MKIFLVSSVLLASGTEKVRPSIRSTMSVSSVTVTFCTTAVRISIAKELIPTLQQIFSVFLDQALDPVDFASLESSTTCGVAP